MALLLAVLERRARIKVSQQDVYVSSVGGVRLPEPGVDLAIALAIASATTDRPLPSDLVVMGEVGLGGEVRQVAHAPRRLAEAARMGFKRALVPASCPDPEREAGSIRLERVRTVAEALAVAGLVGGA